MAEEAMEGANTSLTAYGCPLTAEKYVPCHQKTVTQLIVTRTIIYLCLATDRRPGERVSQWWWEQGRLKLEGIQEAARATEMAEMEGEEDREEQDD